jgi:hypothetical protein
LTGQCKHDEIYFVFFFQPQDEERNPTHIAHISKAPRANAKTKALSKSAIFPTHEEKSLN